MPKEHDDKTEGLLLDKISHLQDERLVLQEKIHMLETSASAMADDLLKKSTLIQYYCMEGRTNGEILIKKCSIFRPFL